MSQDETTARRAQVRAARDGHALKSSAFFRCVSYEDRQVMLFFENADNLDLLARVCRPPIVQSINPNAKVGASQRCADLLRFGNTYDGYFSPDKLTHLCWHVGAFLSCASKQQPRQKADDYV
jgi:hypothetical protein